MYVGIIPIRFLRNHLPHAGKALCFLACLIKHAYGKHENEAMESAMPSPMEKGDRGAVDQGYPGIKENGERSK